MVDLSSNVCVICFQDSESHSHTRNYFSFLQCSMAWQLWCVCLAWWEKVGMSPFDWRFLTSRIVHTSGTGRSFWDVFVLSLCGEFRSTETSELFAIEQLIQIFFFFLLLFGLMQWELLEEFLCPIVFFNCLISSVFFWWDFLTSSCSVIFFSKF